jgi:N-acetylglucosaminyl-diphospho-decaprenol L-rhamnosyltransferase
VPSVGVVPSVGAVVGTYMNADVIGECLDSLARQTVPPASVVVVDAGSDDETRAIARARGAVVVEAENRGLGHLYNVGAHACRTDLVLLSNPDVSYEERCVEVLRSALAARPDAFAADPAQLDWRGESQVHGAATITPGPLLRSPLPGLRLAADTRTAGITEVPFANAGAMLVRRERLLQLGGFDETFFLDYEDLDLCWRAWMRGWSSVHVPDAVLRHDVGGGGSARVRRRRLVGAHHNLVRFALKCLPGPAAVRVVAGELLRAPRHPHIVAPALGRVVCELPAIFRERRAIRPRRDVYARLVGS